MPPLPKAEVTAIEPVETELPVVDLDGNEVGTLDTLETEYKFSAVEPTAAQAAYYNNWYADYRVSFDNAVAANTVGLHGAYEGFGTEYAMTFVLPNAMAKDEQLYLLTAAGLAGVTYKDIHEQVQDFICGAFNLDEANVGTTMTVELVIWDPAVENAEKYVVATQKYTFTGVEHIINTYTVTVSAQDTEGNLVGNASGGNDYNYGDTVVVDVVVPTGYTFIGWFKDSYSSEKEPVSIEKRYAFTAEGNEETINLVAVLQSSGSFVLTVEGNNYIVNNGPVQTAKSYYTGVPGDQYQIEYLGEDFRYWVNESNNIISTSPSFTYTLVSPSTVKLLTSETYDEEIESAYLVFLNAYETQVMATSRIGEADEFTLPKITPSKMGYTFDKWIIKATGEEATEDSIAQYITYPETVVTIVPSYIQSEDMYTIKLMLLDRTNGNTEAELIDTIEKIIGEKHVVRTTDIYDGTEFRFWSLDGGITATTYDSEQYTVLSSQKDEIIELTLVVGGEEIVPEATIIVSQSTNIVNGKTKICTTMEYYVPDGYTVVNSGYVFGAKAGVVYDENKLTVENADDGQGPASEKEVRKHMTGRTDNALIYNYNLGVSDTDLKIHIRAFVVYLTSDGTMVTLYTEILHNSYNDILNNN